ncbi:hypothetical protein F2Q69_00019962 [Brassica cretica]|uniref:RNase H type-1 domain-containing protein n=1 Tax=Brassica cretica TaxID=69181 RepID=A0A8S9QQR7_BRACR|nr:hypothetical protein F2Q69_00019962 [Brassica cretica]
MSFTTRNSKPYAWIAYVWWMDRGFPWINLVVADGSGGTAMGNGEHASTFLVSEAIKTLQLCFPEFKISHIPRVQNGISDSLAKNVRSFRRKLCYIGCSIPVWLPRPPQVL